LTQEQVDARTDVTRTGGYKDRWTQGQLCKTTNGHRDRTGQMDTRINGFKNRRCKDRWSHQVVTRRGGHNDRWT
jgi:hypothetical protein